MYLLLVLSLISKPYHDMSSLHSLLVCVLRNTTFRYDNYIFYILGTLVIQFGNTENTYTNALNYFV